jgi:flagellar hook-length control protein FliK
MPAMLLQAMRQSPQLKAESTPVADVGDVPTPASPTPRPVPLVTDVAATSGAATSATTADAAPAASPEQLLAAVSATSGQGADTGADAGAMPVNRGEMPADFGRLTASATVGTGPSLPARGAEFANASVPVPMSNPQWGEAFASRIAMQVRDGVQQVSLALNPAELGPVEVRLSVSDGQVSAHFHSAHQNVRQAIEDAMPRLREMLSQSGLNLADANVSQQAPRRDEHAAGGQGGRWSGTDDDRHAESGDDATTVTATRTLGLVDAYV